MAIDASYIGYRDGNGVITSYPSFYAVEPEEAFDPQANPTFTLVFLDDNNFAVLPVGIEAIETDIRQQLETLAGTVGVGGIQVTDIAGFRTQLGLQDVDVQSVTVFDHFHGDELDSEWSPDAAAGASAGISSVAGEHAAVLDTGATANEWATLARRLIFPASSPLTLFEARVKVSDISDVIFEVGLSDAISETAGLALSSHDDTPVAVADNAALIAWHAEDTGAGEVSNAFEITTVNDGTAARNTTSVAPTADTYFTVAIAVDDNGDIGFFVNGESVGSVEDAIDTSAVLTPWLSISAPEAATARSLTVDWVRVSNAVS